VQIELAPERLRLVVLDERGLGVIDPRFLQRMPLATAVLGGGGIAELGVPHLRSLLPRYAAPDGLPGLAFHLPSAWVYERVPGARLRGRAEPGTQIVARVQLLAGRHRMPYTAWTRATSDGTFELQLPLPSGYRSAGLSTGGDYALTFVGDGAAPRSLSVSERDVRSGAVIDLDAAEAAPQVAAPPPAPSQP
jgi:hypothetical protein